MSRTSAHLYVLFAVSAVMLTVSAWRWHSFHLSSPEGVPGADGAAVVAVLQPRDCPDSRERAEQFLTLARAHGVPALAIRLPARRWPWGPPPGLRELQEAWAQRGLHRAILRSGLRATPAILLVDRRGVVRFAYRVEADASEDLLAESVTAFAATYRLLLAEPAARAVPESPLSPDPTPDPEEVS